MHTLQRHLAAVYGIGGNGTKLMCKYSTTTYTTCIKEKRLINMNIIPRGEWAGPGGTAIPGQPVAKAEQAPDTSPSSKNQFNIVVPQWGTYQILS